jgi:8-oxo-dGTP diphosphatase
MTVLVAAAIVIEHGRVLLSQRKRGTHLEGVWELPGGKVEDGEDPKEALAREMEEELGIQVDVLDIVDVAFHRYDVKTVLILFYEARRRTSAEPRALDVAAFEWVGAEGLAPERFPAADVAVLGKIRARLR